jgi:microcompartment protein CcmL/EutN
MATRNDFNPELTEGLGLGTSIGLLEVGSIARGVEVADAVLWEAPVQMLFSCPVQPGKYVLLFNGTVQAVAASLRRGAELAGPDLLDQLHIQQVHPQVESGLRRKSGTIDGALDAVGVIETTTVAAAILAADLALKTATVDLVDLRIANGLDGKSFLTVTGGVSDVRSSVAAAARLAEERGALAHKVVIPRPHPELARHL